MENDQRTKLEEIGVAIIFAILLVVAISFSLEKGNAGPADQSVASDEVYPSR